jgi:hypothetical protein
VEEQGWKGYSRFCELTQLGERNPGLAENHQFWLRSANSGGGPNLPDFVLL